MNKTISTLILLLTVITFCNAQKIEAKKTFGGYNFYQNDKELNMSELQEIMKNNTKALEHIKKARTNTTFASIFCFTGGFLFGWPIGTEIGGGNANWSIAGIGIGVLGLSIPFISGANKNAKQATEFYNSSLESVSYQRFKTEFNVLGNSNGVGISITF